MPRRLTREQVIRIRELHDAGHTIQEIAEAFQRHPDTISRVVRGITYTRVRETAERLPIPRRDNQGEMVEQGQKESGSAVQRFMEARRRRPSR